jgi:serine/threonine protein kinase
MSGRILANKYEIIKELGSGGMGVVYLGRQLSLDRHVAIKSLSSSVSHTEQERERFKNEALILARLGHPNIVQVFDVVTDGNSQHIVMEYIEGETVHSWLAREGPSIAEAVRIGMAACDALAATHSQSPPIIHRDIKSGNLMLVPGGGVKVLDFGIAATTGGDEEAAGSAEYISPEQAQEMEADARSDIYSLGIVLYELATGRLPFTGETAFAITCSQVNDKPPAPGILIPGFPKDFERVILKCLEKDPGQRYSSATQLREELKKVASRMPSSNSGKKRFTIPLAIVIITTLLIATYLGHNWLTGPSTVPNDGSSHTANDIDFGLKLREIEKVALTQGDIETGLKMVDEMLKEHVNFMSEPEKMEFKKLRASLTQAGKQATSANELLLLASSAHQKHKRQQALELLTKAEKEWRDAVSIAAGLDIIEESPGSKIAILRKAITTDIESSEKASALERTMRQAKQLQSTGKNKEALNLLTSLLPNAPEERKSEIEATIALLKKKIAAREASKAGFAARMKSARSHLDKGTYHAGLRAVKELEKLAGSREDTQSLALLRTQLKNVIGVEQAKIRRDITKLDNMLEHVGEMLSGGKRDKCLSVIKSAEKILQNLQTIKQNQPGYEVPLEDQGERLQRMRIAAQSLK